MNNKEEYKAARNKFETAYAKITKEAQRLVNVEHEGDKSYFDMRFDNLGGQEVWGNQPMAKDFGLAVIGGKLLDHDEVKALRKKCNEIVTEKKSKIKTPKDYEWYTGVKCHELKTAVENLKL